MPDDDYQAFEQSLAPGSPPVAAAPANEDEEYQKFLSTLAAPSVKPHEQGAAAAAPDVRAPAVPAGPAPEWSEALSQGAKNLLPSAAHVVGDVGSAIIHPGKTLDVIKQLGTGAESQIAGALGQKQEPKQKAQSEAVLNALEDHYKEIYGPLFHGDTKNLRKAIATDPASVLMDASAFITGGSGAAAKAAGTAGKLGKAASIAAKAAQYVDPANLALQAAKKVGQAGTAVGRTAQGIFSGVPASVQKIAAEAGAEADPALRQVFTQYMHGDGDAAEFQQAAQDALGKVRKEGSDEYLQRKSALATAMPSYQPVDDAIKEARAHTMMGGHNAGQFPAANAAIDDVEAMVSRWKAAPPTSGYNSMFGFDNLKQAIWDKVESTPNTVAKNQLKGVYNGVKKALTDEDAGYATMMEKYQEGRNNLNDLTKTFGLGKNTAATAAMAKVFRQMKTEQGQNLFGQLAAKDKRLPYMVAGSALNPWLRGGHGNLLEGIVGAGLFVHNPATLPFSIAAQSPRIAGELNYGLGAAGRRLKPLTSPAGRYAAYKLGNAQGSPAPPHDAVFAHMLNQESGNRQLNADGSPVISPKGAIGAAQVMPSTGPEAATLAGEPWDKDKLVSDEGYNKRLGLAYFKAQVDKFGDPFMAAAAYNAGPHAVEAAVEHARTKGGEYLDYLPKETKDYVAKLLNAKYESQGGRVERASGGKVDDEALILRLMNKMKQAKRATDKTTKPLLGVPDESIVKALDVAQQAI